MLALHRPLYPSGSDIAGDEIARGVSNTDERVLATIRRRLHFVDFIVTHAADEGRQALFASSCPTARQGHQGGCVPVKALKVLARFHGPEHAVEIEPCLYPRRMDHVK